VASDYCAVPGLAFTRGAHGQGDMVLLPIRNKSSIVISWLASLMLLIG